MKNTRKGLGKGLGTGYKNLAPMDSHIHSLSAKGCKTKNLYAKTDLQSRYDSRNSFYGKAVVDDGDGKLTLYSYGTKVAEIVNGKAIVYGSYSQTTMRHIKEFLKQNRFNVENTDQVLKDYSPDKPAPKLPKISEIKSGELFHSYPTDSFGGSNTGDAKVYIYKGKRYEIDVPNETADENSNVRVNVLNAKGKKEMFLQDMDDSAFYDRSGFVIREYSGIGLGKGIKTFETQEEAIDYANKHNIKLQESYTNNNGKTSLRKLNAKGKLHIEPTYVPRGSGNNPYGGKKDLHYKIKEWGFVFPSKESAEKYADEHIEINGIIVEKKSLNAKGTISKRREQLRKAYIKAGEDLNKEVNFWGEKITLNKAIDKMDTQDITQGYKGLKRDKEIDQMIKDNPKKYSAVKDKSGRTIGLRLNAKGKIVVYSKPKMANEIEKFMKNLNKSYGVKGDNFVVDTKSDSISGNVKGSKYIQLRTDGLAYEQIFDPSMSEMPYLMRDAMKEFGIDKKNVKVPTGYEDQEKFAKLLEKHGWNYENYGQGIIEIYKED